MGPRSPSEARSQGHFLTFISTGPKTYCGYGAEEETDTASKKLAYTLQNAVQHSSVVPVQMCG